MSVQLTYPGVYIEELSSGVHAITGVATSIAAFIGWAPKGPVDRAVLVESWPEYESRFGPLYPGVYLGYAVNQFFANGGKQAYVIRLVWDGTLATATSPAPEAAATAHASNVGGALTLYASSPGTWAKDLQVRLVPQTGSTTRFSLRVINATNGNVLESFANLSVKQSDPRYMVTVVDTDSQYVTFVNPANPAATITPPASIAADTIPAPAGLAVATQSGGALPQPATFYYTFTAIYPDGESQVGAEKSAATTAANRTLHLTWTAAANFNGKAPKGYRVLRGTAPGDENVYFVVGNVTTFTDDGTVAPSPGSPQPTASVAWPLTGGKDGGVLAPSTSDFENALLNDLSGHGLQLLDRVPIFNLLCVPGETNAATIQELQAYAAAHRAFCIVDADQYATVETLRTNGPAGLTNAPNAANSALYFPWVSAPDPLAGNRPTLMPPSGFVAGIFAATDAARGVWKAPAGLNAGLTGVLGLQYTLTDLENGDLNVLGINCLREFRIYGDVVWGARTLLGADEVGSQWKYVPIRRLALFLETSLYEGTQWVVFEPNDERLWSQIRLNVGAFMQQLFLQGAFQGSTPQTAYFVKSDAENNPQPSIDQGVVNILVGFAPLYPAEFVVIQIQQLMANQG
jgi:phage tail sheath protein FI